MYHRRFDEMTKSTLVALLLAGAACGGSSSRPTTPPVTTDPVSVTGPTASAGPTESAAPVEVATPAEPAAPAEAAKPIEPAKPVEAAKPATPAKSVEAATPAEAAKPAVPAKPIEPAKPAAPDPAKIKADLLAAEMAAYQKAKPVFDRYCASCHSKDGKRTSTSKREHFDMTTYPFGGHHAMEISSEIRVTLGLTGKRPTMPADKRGAVKGEELALIKAWADAFDASHKGGQKH